MAPLAVGFTASITRIRRACLSDVLKSSSIAFNSTITLAAAAAIFAAAVKGSVRGSADALGWIALNCSSIRNSVFQHGVEEGGGAVADHVGDGETGLGGGLVDGAARGCIVEVGGD